MKYKSKKTTIAGIKFDSIAEASFYLFLKEKRIYFEMQPKVYLTKAKILYKPDFVFIENGRKVYVDVKGQSTPVFAIKARLWKFYGDGDLRIVKAVYRKGAISEFKITKIIHAEVL